MSKALSPEEFASRKEAAQKQAQKVEVSESDSSLKSQNFKEESEQEEKDIRTVFKSAFENILPKHQGLPQITVQELPSLFKPYPQGCEIAYVTYNYRDLKTISTSKNSPLENRRIQLEGIYTSFDKNLLTYMDFLYISLLRKISTLGASTHNVSIPCNKSDCPGSLEASVSIQDLEMRDLEIEALPISIDIGKDTLQFSPLTVGAFNFLEKTGRLEDPIAVLAAQASNMSFEKAFRILGDVKDVETISLLEYIDTAMLHEVKPITLSCSLCKNTRQINIDVNHSLITAPPFRPDGESLRTRIRFGS